jgi:hypothetical protein
MRKRPSRCDKSHESLARKPVEEKIDDKKLVDLSVANG